MGEPFHRPEPCFDEVYWYYSFLRQWLLTNFCCLLGPVQSPSSFQIQLLLIMKRVMQFMMPIPIGKNIICSCLLICERILSVRETKSCLMQTYFSYCSLATQKVSHGHDWAPRSGALLRVMEITKEVKGDVRTSQ